MTNMRSPLEQFLKLEQEDPQRIFLRQPIDGDWKIWTRGQAADEARRLAAGFRVLGLLQGDHVAILSKNCAHWIIADIALMMAGCVSIPIYPTLSADAIEPILVHSDAKAIVIGKLDDYTSQEAGIPNDIIRVSVGLFGIHE